MARAGTSLVKPGELNSVAAFSTKSAWAVGSRGLCHPTPVIARWDGEKWALVPAPPGVRKGTLLQVSGISAKDAWAVGWSGPLIGNRHSLMLHWNGSKWAQVALPAAKVGGTLAGVSASSASNAWAVGFTGNQPYVVHSTGGAWKSVPLPRLPNKALLAGVTAISARNVWAVGTILSKGLAPLILHWNGHVWSRSAAPHLPGGSFLNRVTAVGKNELWAAGFTAARKTVILQRTGSTWRRTATPNVKGGINEVTAITPSNAWAVGSTQEFFSVSCAGLDHGSKTMIAKVTGIRLPAGTRLPVAAQARASQLPLIFHWNGTRWQPVKSAALPKPSALQGVSATSATDIWAVGGVHYFQSKATTLILHSNGKTWG